MLKGLVAKAQQASFIENKIRRFLPWWKRAKQDQARCYKSKHYIDRTHYFRLIQKWWNNRNTVIVVIIFIIIARCRYSYIIITSFNGLLKENCAIDFTKKCMIRVYQSTPFLFFWTLNWKIFHSFYCAVVNRGNEELGFAQSQYKIKYYNITTLDILKIPLAVTLIVYCGWQSPILLLGLWFNLQRHKLTWLAAMLTTRSVCALFSKSFKHDPKHNRTM